MPELARKVRGEVWTEGDRMYPGYWEVWVNHFEYHALNPSEVPEGASDRLTPTERRCIARSIAIFQLGEQSEGRALQRAAERFSVAHRLPLLTRIVELLIAEEQRHAALLRRFMEDHAIPRLPGHWTDRIFRRVRRFAGLELCLNVLLCAELIGIVYYRALEAVTRCQRLRRLCRTLIADELAHVGFESELLRSLRAPRRPWSRAFVRRAHRGFVAGSAWVVWRTHLAVLRPAGYDAVGFVRACLAQHDFYMESTVVDRVADGQGAHH